MSTSQPPANSPAAPPPTGPNGPASDNEIPLEDIDRLLSEEDPEFVQQMNELKSVQVDSSIEIEATVVAGDDDGGDSMESDSAADQGRIKGLLSRFKSWRITQRARLGALLVTWRQEAWAALKRLPGQILRGTKTLIGFLTAAILIPVGIFKSASRQQRLGGAIVAVLLVVFGWVLIHNLKGGWLPQINEPVIASLELKADSVHEHLPSEKGESFYAAFPQELHQYLFPKMKVNMKRTQANPWPMGAFEVVVELDSRDTAIEIRDRESEFFDLLQRLFEEEVVTDLEHEIGKVRLKGRIKREFNQKLTQGWVRDVHFKTFVLKP